MDPDERVLESFALTESFSSLTGSYDDCAVARMRPFELDVGALFPPRTR